MPIAIGLNVLNNGWLFATWVSLSDAEIGNHISCDTFLSDLISNFHTNSSASRSVNHFLLCLCIPYILTRNHGNVLCLIRNRLNDDLERNKWEAHYMVPSSIMLLIHST